MTASTENNIYSTNAPFLSQHPRLHLDPWRLIALHVILLACCAFPFLLIHLAEKKDPTPDQSDQYAIQEGVYLLQGAVYLILLLILDLFIYFSQQKLTVETDTQERVLRVTSQNRFFGGCSSSTSTTATKTIESAAENKKVSMIKSFWSTSYIVPFDEISHLQSDTVDNDELYTADDGSDEQDEDEQSSSSASSSKIIVPPKKKTESGLIIPDQNPNCCHRKYPTPIKIITRNRALLLDQDSSASSSSSSSRFLKEQDDNKGIFSKLCSCFFSWNKKSKQHQHEQDVEEVDDSFIVLEFPETWEAALHLRQWEHFLKKTCNISHLKKAKLPSKDLEEEYSADETVVTTTNTVLCTRPNLVNKVSYVYTVIILVLVVVFQHSMNNLDLSDAAQAAEFSRHIGLYLTTLLSLAGVFFIFVFTFAKKFELKLDTNTKIATWTSNVFFLPIPCLRETREIPFSLISRVTVNIAHEDLCKKNKIKFVMLEYIDIDNDKQQQHQQIILRSGGFEAREMERTEQVKRGYERLFKKLSIDLENGGENGEEEESGDVALREIEVRS